MKHTKQEIIEIAKQVMKDIDWPYDEKRGPTPLEYTIEEQIERVSSQKNHPKFKEYIALLYPYWSVIFDFPEDDGWQDRNVMRVLIKDETGEPYEIGHRQWKGKIVKNSKGKYEKQEY